MARRLSLVLATVVSMAWSSSPTPLGIPSHGHRQRPGLVTLVRGAVAGAVAAAVWVAAEPLGRRVFRTQYSIVRLLGALLTARAPWRRVGIVAHLANGAFFGAIFGRMSGGGWRQGLVVAEIENLVLWPAMAIVDRVHPDRRSGSWPPLMWSPRVFALEATMHALFGVVLGLLHPAPRDKNRHGQFGSGSSVRDLD